MTDVKDFFIASNIVRNAPDYDSKVLSTLIHTVEAFARVTYQSVYLIHAFEKLGVTNITEAVSRAALNKLF